MTAHLLRSGLLTFALLLLTACTLDVGRSSPSTSAADDHSSSWAVTLQRQSSIAGSGLREIAESDLRSGDLLFSSSLGVTSLGIRAFSASSVSHVALYVGEGQVAEATGAGVQVITLQQALAHSDKLFALRVPDLTPDQATTMKSFAWQVKDNGYNYRGIIQFIPYMVTKPLCSLHPFSRDFPAVRQRPGQSAAGRCGKRRQESVVLLGVCQRGLCPSRTSADARAGGVDQSFRSAAHAGRRRRHV